MHKLHILLAEDMAHERLAIMAGLKAALPQNVTADFTCIDYGEGAVERVKAQAFDLVILDLDFSQSPRSKGMTGLQASIQIKDAAPDLYTVVVSSTEEESTMARAVEECGVDWYLRRSAISFDELAWLARQSLLSRLHREGALVPERYTFVTATPAAKQVLRSVDAILPGQNVLIYGETGTGKELVARRIHANAKTFDGKRPLKVLDCSALTPQLFESEVFGHKKGSFTGAMHDRKGALEIVNGGDLFLDEIHNISPFLQQKLLRVLNDGVFTPVGSNDEVRSKFRIIAATNIPLDEAISSGKLLPDFVERIRKIKVELPPLRRRQADIPLLIDAHLKGLGSFDKEFSEDAVVFMQRLSWRGNIRELKGFIDTAVAEVKIPIISRRHLESLMPGNSAAPAEGTTEKIESDAVLAFADQVIQQGMDFPEVLRRLETAYLSKNHGRYESIRSMADALGYDRRTLAKRLRELGFADSK
jgi:two-component system response regulator HydG